jgi:hypothetical protein
VARWPRHSETYADVHVAGWPWVDLGAGRALIPFGTFFRFKLIE